MTRRIVIGISGASGAPYAARLCHVLDLLRETEDLDVSIVLSRTAPRVWEQECAENIFDLPFPIYQGRDYSAPFASGSADCHGMVIVPASMSCVARIAHGISDDLLTRAADVMIKERRSLVVVPRESPLSSIHLQNMLLLSQSGAVIMPASPSFYGRPATLAEALDTIVARILDHLGIRTELQKRWGDESTLGTEQEPWSTSETRPETQKSMRPARFKPTSSQTSTDVPSTDVPGVDAPSADAAPNSKIQTESLVADRSR